MTANGTPTTTYVEISWTRLRRSSSSTAFFAITNTIARTYGKQIPTRVAFLAPSSCSKSVVPSGQSEHKQPKGCGSLRFSYLRGASIDVSRPSKHKGLTCGEVADAPYDKQKPAGSMGADVNDEKVLLGA